MRATRNLLERLFEGAPRFVERLAAEASHSVDELLERAGALAASMPENEQVELLNAHPRIGADPDTVSELSYREQGYDRGPGTRESRSRLEDLNERYEARFGFRFVVYVAGRSRDEIAELLEQSLDAPRDEEKRRALGDVVAIARDRLERMRQPLERRR